MIAKKEFMNINDDTGNDCVCLVCRTATAANWVPTLGVDRHQMNVSINNASSCHNLTSLYFSVSFFCGPQKLNMQLNQKLGLLA